ncbi:MAG TPA: ABC transporter substrate-binding protein [Rhodocyclaceae bacterium]|nr:ABC transporter substrate-binding protein [Rhodocyclaceae bacterium]
MNTQRTESRRLPAAALCAAAVAVGMVFGMGSAQAAVAPIRIGVIAPFAAIDGASIINGAELAVDEINASGGIDGRKVELFKYDNHASATDGVRAFQRAVKQDHVVAMVGTFISEVALAMQPWSARLHTPFIVTGAASTDITKNVREHYSRNKYTFHEWINSYYLGRSVCDFAQDVLAPAGASRAVVMSEDAAWTKPLDASYLECLPKAGLKVVDHIRFAPDTNDFTPIFNKIEGLHANVIIAGWAHVGVKPTVQWHDQHVPVQLAGISAQAGASTFWKATNGATEGVISESSAVPGEKLTSKTEPFTEAYTQKFGTTPAYNAYSTDDAIYVLKQAIERAHSTNANALVKALEKTDYVGTFGRVEFYGPKAKYAHGMKYGKGYVTGTMFQWQNGKQVPIWPTQAATAKPELALSKK